MPFMLASFDLFPAFGSKGGIEEEMERKQLRRGWGAVLTTSLHLFSVFSTPPPDEPLICQEARALGLAPIQNSRPKVSAKQRSEDTRQQRLLVVRVQYWQCHQRHVIPALRCSDANPYLPRQLFHSRVEGTADMSQPAGNLSAQSTPSIKENIQSRAGLCPAVNIYCCTKSHPLEARVIFIHLSVVHFLFPSNPKAKIQCVTNKRWLWLNE